MKGYTKKILRINLTTGKIDQEQPSDDFYKNFLGGTGFIIHTLLNELKKNTDPLGEENKLIFALGPVTGHRVPGSGRNVVGSKSPLTNTYGESEAGGFWGPELKFAGFDAVLIEGKSPDPVYLWIRDGSAEIRNAKDIWGKDTLETEVLIKKDLKKYLWFLVSPERG